MLDQAFKPLQYCFVAREEESIFEKDILFTIDSSEMFDFLLHNNNQMALGAYAGHVKSKNVDYFYRDPLGLSKLYVANDRTGELLVSRSWLDLLKKNINPDSLCCIPPGTIVEYKENSFCKIQKILLAKKHIAIDDIPAMMEFRLKMLFESLSRFFDKSKFDRVHTNLALSGGLDSSTLSVFATSLPDFKAHTIALPSSSDALIAKQIAERLNINHFIHDVSESTVLEALLRAPIEGEDWRDFNVHCSAINSILARMIRSVKDDFNLIITGDLMNEFVCDYDTESYEGKSYYQLPQVSKKRLQSWLIKGLSSSSREDHVFGLNRMHVLQPYSILVDLYLNLSNEQLSLDGIKRKCNIGRFNSMLTELISDTKLRAQVGSKDTMGILGIAVRNLQSNDSYLETISDFTGVDTKAIKELIYAGKFRELEL